MLQALYAIVLSSDVFDARACVCVVHWHCTAQLSMCNMEKRYRNKIIIIIIIIIIKILFFISLRNIKICVISRVCRTVSPSLSSNLN